MDSPQYNVLVDGAVLDGFATADVLQQLQQQLKLPEAKARLLIAGRVITVKRDLEEPVAQAYCARLRALGVEARIANVTQNAASTLVAAATAAPRSIQVRYFTDAPLAAADVARTKIFRRAVMRANTSLWLHTCAYAALALLGIALLLGYMIGYAGFLLIPPIAFSASVYLTISLTLAWLALLICRPLLMTKRDAEEISLISPLQEPQIFSFITQLCEKLSLKAPTEIAFSTAAINSAALLPGFKNIKQGEYRLSLSFPALENTSLSQFAALVAADLATQSYLPSLRYRALRGCLRSRVGACLTQRDWLAHKLTTLQQSTPKFISRGLQWLTKSIELTNRQLEKFSQRLDRVEHRLQRAWLNEHDRCSALTIGTDKFADLMITYARLSAAALDANEKNYEDRIEGGIVTDLPALIRHYHESTEDNFARDTQRQWHTEVTPRRDEAPIMRERIEHITNQSQPGLITNTDAASTLLQQRDALAQRVTLDSYRNAGLPFDPTSLMPTDELTYIATQDILQRQQATIYFNDWFKPFRFWSLADYALISEMPLQDASMQLSVCVNEIRRLSPDRARLLAEYERLHNQLREILIAQHVLAAGKKFTFRYIHYDGTSLVPVLEDRQKEIAAIAEKLLQQETVMGGRITLGLRLSGQDQRDVHDLHDALRLLHEIGTRLYKISLDCFQLDQLLQRHHELREADYSLPIKKLETKIDDASRLLIVRLNDIPYPLDTRHASLKSFVENTLAQLQTKSRSPILARAQRLLDVLYRVNEKLSRQAADYGTIAEEAYRIEPIRLVGHT